MHVSVYFSCEADSAILGTAEQPLYLFTREIPPSISDTLAYRLRAALHVYLAGPLPREMKQGYFSPVASAAADDLSGVSISDGTATVDFDISFEDHIGNLGTSTASQVFLLEIQATAFQFPKVSSLEFSLGGACDRFWRMLEASCRTLERKG